jgi:YidC/Oxa1 family membrane protein insertase
MGLVAKLIGYIMSFIYGLVDNYGLSIIILTILTRVVMLPLYAKQIEYSAKMSVIQDEVKDIQTKYARDQVKANEKLQEIYARENISPTSGCLPMLIQFPIIIGLFTLLRNPLSYMSQPAMVMAVHESFLWIKDLCQPDNWILPILAGVTTYLTTQATASAGPNAGMNSALMKYMYPIMIVLLGRSFPAGLALYWSIGNIFTIGQTLIMNKMREKTDFEAAVEREARRNVKRRKNQQNN